MRISDWSSDVCSSDLARRDLRDRGAQLDGAGGAPPPGQRREAVGPVGLRAPHAAEAEPLRRGDLLRRVGRRPGRRPVSDDQPEIHGRTLPASARPQLEPVLVFPLMGFPTDVGVIDLMLGIPEGTKKSWYGFLRSEEHTSELQSLMRISSA